MSWFERRWYSKQPAPCYLRPLSCLYSALSKRKKKSDLARQWRSPVPIIVVGNISVGGTGKTPLTISLIERLKSEGFNPGIVSRGYKAQASAFPFDVSKAHSAVESGDEPYMLAQRCQCPVIIDPDRPAAARYLLEHYQCDLIISDDGLQHYKLGRDIELVVIDGERGLGNGALMPAGPLRESVERLAAVDFVITNGSLKHEIAGLSKSFAMELEPSSLHNCVTGESASMADFKGATVHGVAGIGNPQRFFNTLTESLQVNVIPHAKADHSLYTQQDFEFSDQLPVFMTEKDAVKVTDLSLSNVGI